MKAVKIVLIADDDLDDRFFIRNAFKEVDEEIIVVEVENGVELLKLIEKNALPEPSLIVLDMNMPLMTGLETFAVLKRKINFIAIPTIMLSTSSEPALSEKARREGMTDYFVKPYTYTGFITMAHELKSRFLK